MPPDPIRPTDDDARALARGIGEGARLAALGTLDGAGGPHVTRVAVIWEAGPVTLVSTLSDHTRHLDADPRASLLLGGVEARGDPLNQPRLTLTGRAEILPPDDPGRPALRAAWLAAHPKAKLYIDFADFRFVRLRVAAAHLNGGFGKAYRLTPADLGLA